MLKITNLNELLIFLRFLNINYFQILCSRGNLNAIVRLGRSNLKLRYWRKKTVNSILKSEFGLFKKDSSITTFQAKEEIKEEIKVNFNPKVKTEKPAVIPKEQKPKKEEKIKKNLQHWKEQEEEENENIIVVGKGKGK